MKNYAAPDERLWIGRQSTLENQYRYQAVQLVDLERQDLPDLDFSEKAVALLGYAADEGVSRNQGRPGAINGPQHIRQQLAKLPLHSKSELFDFGDINCSEDGMEGGQAILANTVSQLIDADLFPVLLGGGHDIAFGHYVGLTNSGTCKDKTVGIINFDAHFDLRSIEAEGNSGTPFFQIQQRLKKQNKDFKYLALGIQEQSNTQELFDRANESGVDYILSNAFTNDNSKAVLESIKIFISEVDFVYITIDMDGFSSAYAPGVSAPSAFGFEPNFIVKILNEIFNSQKVISCDIAELNPIYDQDFCTAKLAARLADIIIKFHQLAQ